jgi:hypothetical protein
VADDQRQPDPGQQSGQIEDAREGGHQQDENRRFDG